MPDLAVTNRNTSPSTPGNVAVLLGNGDGTFQVARNFRVRSEPYSVAVADFNRDGKPDLAVANSDSKSISVMIGNGDGTVQEDQNACAGVDPYAVASVDFTCDDVLD